MTTGTKCSRWTPDEDEVVRRDYATVAASSIASVLGRSLHAVRQRAYLLGVRGMAENWSEAELQTLREHYGRLKSRDVAKLVGRARKSCISKARQLGITYRTNGAPWSAAEVQFLRERYGFASAADIARQLGRGLPAVRRRALLLGLRVCGTEFPPAVLDQVTALHRRGLHDAQIAREAGLSWTAVRHIRRRVLRLKSNRGPHAGQIHLWTAAHPAPFKRAIREFARSCGWPEGLRIREVQILNLLAAKGCLTRAELQELCGFTGKLWKGGTKVGGREKGYFRRLLDLGLIVELGQGYRQPKLLMLTMKAIDALERHLAAQRGEGAS